MTEDGRPRLELGRGGGREGKRRRNTGRVSIEGRRFLRFWDNRVQFCPLGGGRLRDKSWGWLAGWQGKTRQGCLVLFCPVSG